jgi:hypothetical protein
MSQHSGCSALCDGYALGCGSRRGPFAAACTLLQPHDFRQHIFRLSFHFQVCQVAVLMVFDAQFVLHSIEHVQHPCQLVFGQQLLKYREDSI